MGGTGGEGGGESALHAELVNTYHGDNGPFGMVVGPDGGLWLSFRYCWDFGRVSSAGPGSGFTFPRTSSPIFCAMVTGSDGKLWVGDTGALGRFSSMDDFVDLPLKGGSDANGAPVGIAVGPDGNIWFTEQKRDYIGRMTSDGFVTEFAVPGTDPTSIVTGPDRNLWFREAATNKIGRLTEAGVLDEFPLLGPDTGYGAIAVGPDGALWFAEVGRKAIGRITTTGVVTEFSGAGLLPLGAITAGADGNLWFTETYEPTSSGGRSFPRIGRITPAGEITHVPLQFTGFTPFETTAVVAGRDGKIWFAASDTFVSGVGRIVGNY